MKSNETAFEALVKAREEHRRAMAESNERNRRPENERYRRYEPRYRDLDYFCSVVYERELEDRMNGVY